MFNILFCKYVKCSSVDDYNTLFTKLRYELTNETNYYLDKQQPIMERTDLSSKSTVYVTKQFSKDAQQIVMEGQL